jgi:mevalonate kinase
MIFKSMNKKIFPAKLLLFGEYAILLGSAALSMPFFRFGASLRFFHHETGDGSWFPEESNRQLKKLCNHFLENRSAFTEFLDLDRFQRELESGLYLFSNIPQRYGMGSSGALCAAVYHRYSVDAHNAILFSDRKNLIKLRKSFIMMESFFHGKSSGFDPLVSSLKIPLHLDRDSEVAPIDLHRHMKTETNIHLLLIDSCLQGGTGPLVNDFLEQFAPREIITALGNELTNLTNESISTLLNNDAEAFWKTIRQLTRFQLNELVRMVPLHLRPAWSEGLQTGLFSLKLCGSGGGGFLVCFTSNQKSTVNYFNDRKIPVITAPFSEPCNDSLFKYD